MCVWWPHDFLFDSSWYIFNAARKKTVYVEKTASRHISLERVVCPKKGTIVKERGSHSRSESYDSGSVSWSCEDWSESDWGCGGAGLGRGATLRVGGGGFKSSTARRTSL